MSELTKEEERAWAELVKSSEQNNSFDKIEIYISQTGSQNFNDQRHLDNFLKYLYSNSKAHQPNQMTKYNCLKDKDGIKFIDSQSLQQTKNKIKELFTHSALKNIISYIFIVVTYNNKHYSNFLVNGINGIETKLISKDEMNSFDTTEKSFFEQIKDYLDGNIHSVLYDLYDLTKEQIMEIEKEVYKYLKDNEENRVLAVSHHDQEVFHIHEIYKRG